MKPDLEAIMMRKSVDSMESDRVTCARCQRTPLAGELVYRLESNQRLCGLCLGTLPESDRAPVRSERVGAAERALPVGPRAA